MGAGHEQRELQELPPVERQVFNLVLVDDFANRRADRVEQRHRLADHDVGGHGARFERQVQAEALVHLEPHVHFRVREALEPDGQAVLARLQPGDLERAILAARGGPGDATIDVAHGHARARNGELLLVEHQTGHAGRRVLCGGCHRQGREEECDRDADGPLQSTKHCVGHDP